MRRNQPTSAPYFIVAALSCLAQFALATHFTVVERPFVEPLPNLQNDYGGYTVVIVRRYEPYDQRVLFKDEYSKSSSILRREEYEPHTINMEANNKLGEAILAELMQRRQNYRRTHYPSVDSWEEGAEFVQGLIGFVLLLKDGDINQMEAGVAFYQKHLPSEIRFDVEFPSPTPTRLQNNPSQIDYRDAEFSEVPILFDNYQEGDYFERNNIREEDIVEIDTLFNESSIDWIPNLLLEAERERLTYFGRRDEQGIVFPARYVMSTHVDNLTLFTQSRSGKPRMNFQLMEDMPRRSDVIYLEHSRQSWMTMATSYINARPGARDGVVDSFGQWTEEIALYNLSFEEQAKRLNISIDGCDVQRRLEYIENLHLSPL